MNGKSLVRWMAILLIPVAAGGCATAARDTTGFALQHSATVEAPKDEVWQTVKSVLRERGLEIYTRDTRGKFVAYSEMHRRLLVPERTQHSIEIVEVDPNESQIYIDTVRQVYGVTLLTYPGWHDRKTTDESEAVAILEAIQAKVSGAPVAPAAEAETAAVPETVEAAPTS
ncbi:MAG: hypothetical protein IT368_04980 [Candidatus Hydrogenedentes bacterium]|nr:hypothetical protein [Candidatus Hydrogenedentota bacterium]